ncbi:MAG: SDR family NAD(P)-dependent oxidoreductase, partial [Rhodobiaceae bacterium]
MNKHILFFGFGYCAQFLAPLLAAQGWHISATCRNADKAARLQGLGINALMLDGAPLSVAALDGVSHIVLSAAPSDDGDPALPLLRDALAHNPTQFQWLGYLSTTGVYGDHEG